MKFNKHALIVAIAAGVTAMAAQATEFRSADIHPDDYPTVTAVKFMSERLKALSGGKHTIKVFNNSALGQEKDTIEQTKIGALSMVRVNIAPMNNICPETQVPTMPFLFRSVDHLHKVLDGPIGEEILKSCEKQGFIGLAYYDSGARSMFTAKKPVRSFADMKGQKVRVQATKTEDTLFPAYGAQTVHMPFGDVYTSLQTGVVNVAENGVNVYLANKHYEVAPILSMTEHEANNNCLWISDKTWNSLTPEQQKWVQAAADEVAKKEPAMALKLEKDSAEKLKSMGVKVVEGVDKTGFMKAAQPVQDQLATELGPHAVKLLKLVRDLN